MIDNATLNLFSVLVLAILFGYSFARHEKGSFQQTTFHVMLLCTICLLLVDTFSRFDGYPDSLYSIFNRLGNFVLFILNPVLPSIWFVYIDFHLYHDGKRIKRLLFPLLALIAANTAMIVLSQWNGWYYSIDSANIYHRGPLFLIPAMLTTALLLAAFFKVAAHKNKLSKKHFIPLMLFPTLPFACVMLQIFIYGLAFALNGTVLSLMIVYLSFQNDDVFTDFLTGVGNRKKLETVIKERVEKSSKGRTFSLVMVDIDNFKVVNDTLGHDMGDKVLKAFAEVLEKSIRSKDYVMRFGGDEFCLILDISDQQGLDAAVSRINGAFNSFAKSGLLPFSPEFSMGYAVYDRLTGMDEEGFLKHVDSLLYENKRKKREALHALANK